MTPSLTGFDVLLSLLGYIAVYAVMFPAGLWFVARIVKAGITTDIASPVEAGRPSAPVKPVPGDTP